MCEALEEIRQLMQMKENVRRSVQALELCWGCERISECEGGIVDDAVPVWLCTKCRKRIQLNIKNAADAFVPLG